jgi:hypothetical protein
MADPRGIRSLEPASDSVRGRREQDIGPSGDDREGVARDACVVRRGRDADRGRVDDLGAAAFEGGDKVLGAPIARDGDTEALELVGAETGLTGFGARVVDGVSGSLV